MRWPGGVAAASCSGRSKNRVRRSRSTRCADACSVIPSVRIGPTSPPAPDPLPDRDRKTRYGGRGGSGKSSIAAAAASASARQVGYRSAGSLAMARAITSSRAGASHGTSAVGRGGGRLRWPAAGASIVSPGNGTLPVSSL